MKKIKFKVTVDPPGVSEQENEDSAQNRMVWKKGDPLPKESKEVSTDPETEFHLKRKVDPKVLKKYTRGDGLKEFKYINSKIEQKKIINRELSLKWAEEQAARVEKLLTEDPGFIEPDEGETPKEINQFRIRKAVDITSATKGFDLSLNFGPYRANYSRNGRFLLLGGKKGHVAAMDWVTKKLLCEINVMEAVFDVQWLHVEIMFAVAQKEWVYIYDNQGVELHCLKMLNKVLRMTFLPYHFLLATANERGWLNWLDVSIGEMVSATNTKQGRLSVMAQNPYNAVLCLGHTNGTVSMWSPSVNKPLATMMCHLGGVSSLSVDRSGKYMATTSASRQLRIWDVRALKGSVFDYQLWAPVSGSSFSDTGLLALSMGNNVEVFKRCHLMSVEEQYLHHREVSDINNIEFGPYEDVLGCAHMKGFTSLIVPGSGEPHFDGYESHPFQSKSQRRETEVKALLEKLRPEFITLDPKDIADIDVPSLRERMEAKTKLLAFKPKVDFTPRRKNRHGSAKMARVKKMVKETRKQAQVKQHLGVLEEEGLLKNITPENKSVLDRFKPKIRQKKKVLPTYTEEGDGEEDDNVT